MIRDYDRHEIEDLEQKVTDHKELVLILRHIEKVCSLSRQETIEHLVAWWEREDQDSEMASGFPSQKSDSSRQI